MSEASVDELSESLDALQLVAVSAEESVWEIAVRVVEQIEVAARNALSYHIVVYAPLPPGIDEMPTRIFHALCKQSKDYSSIIRHLSPTRLTISGPSAYTIDLEWYTDTRLLRVGNASMSTRTADIVYTHNGAVGDVQFINEFVLSLFEQSKTVAV